MKRTASGKSSGRRRSSAGPKVILAFLIIAFIISLVLIVIYSGKVKNDLKVISGEEITASGESENKTSDGDQADTADEETTTQAWVNDTTAPVIDGEAKIFVSVGSTVKYKSYIFVEDDTDPDPKVTIDNSGVDLSKEGTYEVIYTVTDASGNSASRTVTVVVGATEEPDVDESVIYAKADEVLDEIIDDDMTDLQKVFAVFYYVRETFTYVKDNNYWEYKQEAYNMMTTLHDNCYANVCVSKLLLERLGFESFMITGEMGYVDEHHYWNMVSIDGGETWYHYDSAWWTWQYDEPPMCMMTDEFAMELSDAHGGIFDYDTSAFPKTPTEDLWTPDTLESMGLTKEDFGY